MKVKNGAVYIPLCMTDCEAVCEEMIPGGHCIYSDVCRENNARTIVEAVTESENE